MSHHDAPYKPEVVGHAGAGGHFPGNTLAAFARAVDLGVDRIECDVQPSADGDLVLIHDDTIETPAGRRPVSSLSTTELRASGIEIAVLDDLIELTGGRVPLMLDVKAKTNADLLIAAIERFDLAASSSVSCPSIATLRRLRRSFPGMRLGLSRGHFSSGMWTQPGKAAATRMMRRVQVAPLIPSLIAAQASEVMLYYRVATPALIAAIHRIGRTVNLWTVDQPADITRVIALRPDGIISNYPDRVQAALAQLQ